MEADWRRLEDAGWDAKSTTEHRRDEQRENYGMADLGFCPLGMKRQESDDGLPVRSWRSDGAGLEFGSP